MKPETISVEWRGLRAEAEVDPGDPGVPGSRDPGDDAVAPSVCSEIRLFVGEDDWQLSEAEARRLLSIRNARGDAMECDCERALFAAYREEHGGSPLGYFDTIGDAPDDYDEDGCYDD